MPLNHQEIQSLAANLNQAIVNEHLQGFTEFDQDVFFWSLTSKQRIVFCLSHAFPRLYLGGEDLEGASLSTAFSGAMRKMLSRAKILSVRCENGERILYLDLERVNEVYKKERVVLVFEMIPSKPRLLLLDESGTILISTHYSSLESKRPLLRGMKYTLPPKGDFVAPEKPPLDYETYLTQCKQEEEKLIQGRKKNRFGDIAKKAKTKRKAAAKKVEAIERDIQEAKTHLNDGIYGDYIYTEWDSFHKGDRYFIYEGEKIPLDEKKSPQENATAFYKRAKKAKAALEQGESNLAKAKEELENAETLLAMIENLDGEALEQSGKKLGILESGKKEIQSTALLPFLVRDGETRYLFGKNARQNEFLSFLYTSDKNVLWFHVMPGSGAHLLLMDQHPNNAKIQLACELALLASGQETGDLMYTERKNIRRGNYVGQAIVKTYQSAHIPKVSEKAKALFASARRVEMKAGD